MNAEVIERTYFLFVCAHLARPPSIRILIGSKYEIYHLKGLFCLVLCEWFKFRNVLTLLFTVVAMAFG